MLPHTTRDIPVQIQLNDGRLAHCGGSFVARMEPTGRANARPMTGSAQSGAGLSTCWIPGLRCAPPGLRLRRLSAFSAHAGHLQARLAAGTVHAKRLDEAALLLGHEHGSAVGAAKAEVGRLLSAHGHLPFKRSIGRDNGDLAGRKPRQINPAYSPRTFISFHQSSACVTYCAWCSRAI